MYERQTLRRRRPPPLLGRARARDGRRRRGPDGAAPRRGRAHGHRGAPRRRRGGPGARRGRRDRRRRRRAARDGAVRTLARRRGRARRGRLRGRPADARAPTSAPTGTWPRCAARRTTPARCCARRSTHGAAALRALERLPRDPVGRRRAADRRPRADQPLLAPVLSARHRRQRATGERFLDEGADFRNYTYARYGAEVLRQPEGHRRPALRRQHRADAARDRLRGAGRDARRRRTRSASWPSGLGIDPERLERDRRATTTPPCSPGAVRPVGQGRQAHRRPHAAEVQLGAAASRRRRSSPSR